MFSCAEAQNQELETTGQMSPLQRLPRAQRYSVSSVGLNMDLPIVCTLTEDQLQERRREVLTPLRDSVVKSEELADGYLYTFKPSPEMLMQLARLVDLERQCCRFLNFKIVTTAGDDAVRLEVTGASAK